MLRRLLLVVMLAAAVLWPQATPAQTDDPGPVRVGDRWTYEVRDTVTGDIRFVNTVSVVELNDKEITTRLHYRGNTTPRTVVFNPQWGTIDDSTWKYRPSAIGIEAPLEVGKQWRREFSGQQMQTGINWRNAGLAKIVGQEKVTTPAGTFDTYRIETNVSLVNSKDETRSAKQTSVIWYAPAINRWVKRTSEVRSEGRVRDSAIEELIDYSRAP